jgi:hypothetical protein
VKSAALGADRPRAQDLLKDRPRFVYWQAEGFWIGYLEEFPDYPTQGESLEDLRSHLRDLHADLRGGHIRAERLAAASKKIREESIEVNAEFGAFETDPDA